MKVPLGTWGRVWTAAVLERPGPRFQVICDAIDEAIERGDLRPGDRLPSHRALATRLGVALGTVTRAYAEARRRDLIDGEVGRGSYVRQQPGDPAGVRYPERTEHLLDLFRNHPPVMHDLEDRAWANALTALSRRRGLGALMNTAWSEPQVFCRRAGARFVARLDLEADLDDLVDAPGFQSAVASFFAAVCRPGDVLLVPEICFPIVPGLARSFGLRIEPIAIDEHGLRTESLAEAAERHGGAVLFVDPDLHSPTNAIVPIERRVEMARIAREHCLWILEHQMSGFLLAEPLTTLRALAPDRTFLIADATQPISVDLRIAWTLTPEGFGGRLTAATASTTGLTPRTTMEIASRFLTGDYLDRLHAARRESLARRQAMAQEILGRYQPRGHEASHHVWIELPTDRAGRPIESAAVVREAESRGIAITDGSWFAVSGSLDKPSIRVCLGNVEEDVLPSALETVGVSIEEVRAGESSSKPADRATAGAV